MPHLHVLLLYAYGFLLLAGGGIGYLKAGSLPSLIAGGVSGAAILALAVAHRWVYTPEAVLAIALILTAIMGRRYFATKKPVPALPIVVASLFIGALQVYILLRT